MTRGRFAIVAAVTVVLAGLLTLATWASTRGWVGGPNTMMGVQHGVAGGPGMMGRFGLAGDGQRVASLQAARQRAQAFADRLDLRAGEVMQFSNGFYAELEKPNGSPATEVLIDPATGTVTLEVGPAMMWNSEYGMHAGRALGAARVSVAQAMTIAQSWLDEHRAGLTTDDPEEFPGYVTLHTMRGGSIVGMMSVNSVTGAVWYHTWHGTFVAMSEG